MHSAAARSVVCGLFIGMGLAMWLAAASGAAAQEGEAAPVVDRTIYVPFKNLREVLDQQAASAIVSYEEYLRFLKSSRISPAPELPVQGVITESHYRGTVEGDLLRISATYTVQVLGKPWVELPLSFGEAAVGRVEGAGEKVLLRGTGDGTYALLLGEAGEQTVTLELLARVRTSPDGREVQLTVPPVGITTFELTVPESQQTVELTPRLAALPVEAAEGATRVKANLGATRSITARWHPQASLKPDMELLAAATNRQLVTIEGGFARHDAWLTYDVLRGKLQSLRIAVPLGQRVLDVTADAGVRTWGLVEEPGRQVLTVELLSPAEKRVTVEVHTEQSFEEASGLVAGMAANGAASGIHALDTVRENGQVAVRTGEGLELTVTEQTGLTRIGGEDVDPRLKPGAATAFRYYNAQLRLGVSTRAVEPRLLVTQSAQLVFGDDELRIESTLNYQVERAGVFDVSLKVPAGCVIDEVQSSHLREDVFDAATGVLTVRLQQSTQGRFDVVVKWHRPYEAGREAAELDLPVLEPVNVARETGTILVFAPPGIEIVTNTAGLQSAQPAPAAGRAAQGDAPLRSSWTYTRRPLRIPVTTTRKPTRLSANVATSIDVQPETIEVTTRLDYVAEFAGVDTYRFLVPEGAGSGVQIEAESTGRGSVEIKQKSAGAAENGWAPWTVVLQRKSVGAHRLRIVYRLTAGIDPAGGDAAAVEPAISVLLVRPEGKPETPDGAPAVALTRLQGEVRVQKDPTLAVTTEASGGDVEPIDVRELTLLPAEGAAAYRYYRQPDDAGIEVKLTRTRHAVEEVTPTVVERGLVEIATGRHTAATFRCRYRIKTVERQRLRIDLPKELELLGVFVDGVEERLSPLDAAEAGAAQEDVAAYAVGLSRRQRPDGAFTLTLQFNWNVNPPPFEATFGRGEIQFPLPRIGVRRVGADLVVAPIQQLRTVVYVPRSFWLVGTPDRFEVPGARHWWDGLRGDPAPATSRLAEDFGDGGVTPLDFPTEGLTSTEYQNLGGAPQITVVWWDVPKMSIVLSVALALIAFILLRTSWENKLGILLLLVFLALLFGVQDQDALSHGLAAARWGLAFLVLLWILHGLMAQRNGLMPAVAAGPAVATAPAAVVPVEPGPDSTDASGGER